MDWIDLAQDRDRWYLSNSNHKECSKFPSPRSIDTSDQRLLQPFKGPVAVAVCFTGIIIALVKCLSILN
jgi:hypothetical protein